MLSGEAVNLVNCEKLSPATRPDKMLYPLRFEPIFKQYLWGGRRLQSVLDKPIGSEDDYAESWELVDHGQDQSKVAFGPLKGLSLQQLVHEQGESLFGIDYPQQQFPLLFKFLDANRDLSVQVHPNDAQGARLDPPDLGKTEAWVILDAQPGSVIYAGLNPEVDRQTLANCVAAGETETCLHKVEPQVGDCIFIPAGTVHALGAGLVVAEIQQASNTTFRLFDWNRTDAHGNARQLHIEEALQVIDFERGPVSSQQAQVQADGEIELLVACDKFRLERWTFDSQKQIAGDQKCHLLAVLSGSLQVESDPSGMPLKKGQTMLLPASSKSLAIEATEPTVALHMMLP